MSLSSVVSGPLRVLLTGHGKSPINLNFAMEANRILAVLDKLISRAKFVGLLNIFFKNDGKFVREILDLNDHFEFIQACERYQYGRTRRRSAADTKTVVSGKDSNLLDSKLSTDDGDEDEDDDDDDDDAIDHDDDDDEDEQHEDSDENIIEDSTCYTVTPQMMARKVAIRQKGRHDGNLAKAIYTLESYPELQALAKSMEKDLSPQLHYFIKCLTEFKNRMTIRLNESARHYKTKERYMREAYEKNERAKREVRKLEEALVVTKTDANVCLIGRNILINRHLKKIEKIKENSAEAIEKRTKESEKAMVNDWQASVAQQEHLKQDLEHVTERYSTLLKDHLTVEKALKAKRAKLENQVLGWIQKFDQDIREKQTEEEEIQARLDKETDEVNEIQKKLDELEEEYDELMQEKAAYEEEMLERRLYHFIINRSARSIQRTYRLYKARKLAKKLARKGKKGKKK